MMNLLGSLCVFLLVVKLSDAYSFIPHSPSLSLARSRCCSSSNTLQMKLYDWKRREGDETALNDLDSATFTLDNLRAAPGSRKRKSRKGRGIAAGQGHTCGFGMRGQNSRAGRPTRPGFEGGQTPLYRRLPKFVGKLLGPGHVRTIYNVIPSDVLAKVEAGTTVNFEYLFENKMVTKSKLPLHKVVMGSRHDLGESPIRPNLTVQAHAFTATAREAIEAAGGTCQLLSHTTHRVLGEGSDEPAAD